jgi:ABC-2 type transport system permease protein
MFKQFVNFEVRFWLRSWMLWVFFLIVALMFFGAASSDQITVGSSLKNTFRNAPWVVENFYAVCSLLTLLMTTAFVNSAASRDFAHNTHQIIFSTPIRKMDYLA